MQTETSVSDFKLFKIVYWGYHQTSLKRLLRVCKNYLVRLWYYLYCGKLVCRVTGTPVLLDTEPHPLCWRLQAVS